MVSMQASEPSKLAVIGKRLPEVHYQKLLQQQFGGYREVKLPFGRPDLVTDNPSYVWEVEPAARWRHGASQVLSYAAQVESSPDLALYGDAQSKEVLDIYLGLCEIKTPIALWWWDQVCWKSIDSRQACCSMKL